MLSSAGLCAACFVGCASMSKTTGTISQAPFGKTADGTPVEICTLRNSKGMEACIITYGGIVVSLKVPDKNGRFGDVVLGYDNPGGYLTNNPFFGALVGRYGNRIARGKFTLDGGNTRWPSIMRPTTCTAARLALTRGCGKLPGRCLSRWTPARTDLPEQGRRGRVSRQFEGDRNLHPDG